MIEAPERYIPSFFEAGANIITVHVEACTHLHRVIDQIKGLKIGAGVAINPATPLVTLEEILPFVQEVNVMTVNPGFGGQTFVIEMLDKITRLRAMIETRGLDVDIEVDGGVDRETAPKCIEAGANVLIAGTTIFGGRATIQENITKLREAAGKLVKTKTA